jgi:hypothetical protein
LNNLYNLISDLPRWIVLLIFTFLIILLFRILIYILLYISSKIYIFNRAKKIKQIKKLPDIKKVEIEKKVVKIEQEEEEIITEKRVGFAKPIGVWTSLILGDEITKTLERANEISEKNGENFWKSVAEAEARNSVKKIK